MTNPSSTSVVFKRDYVAASAVILFFFIVAAEISLAIAIPVVLGKASLYAEQEARQRMLDAFDSARFLCYQLPSPNQPQNQEKPKNPLVDGELSLILWNLDSLAIYLRKNAPAMSLQEINDTAADIAEFTIILQNIRKYGPYCATSELNLPAYFNSLAKPATSTQDPL